MENCKMVELKLEDIETKHSKVVFESLLFYSAFWGGHPDPKREEWTLRELYGEAEEKHFITSKNLRSLYPTTMNRITILEDNYVNIERIPLKENVPRESQKVRIEREKIIQEFIEEIKLKSIVHQKIFQNVINTAIPLIQIQTDYYHQKQHFSHSQLEPVMRVLSFIFQYSPKVIKYFPILLSFNDAILSENSLMEARNPGNKWRYAKEEAIKTGIYQKVTSFFLWQIPAYAGFVSSFMGFEPEKAKEIDLYELFKKDRLNEFFKDIRQTLNQTDKDFCIPIVEENLEQLLLFIRLSKKVINVKIPKLFELKKKNEVEVNRRIRACSQGIFLSSLVSLISVEEVDYKKDLIIKYEVPTKKGIIKKEHKVSLRLYM